MPKSALKTEAEKLDEVSRALKAMPDRFLRCRSYRYHALEETRIFEWRPGAICRVSQCGRCGTVAHDFYNAKGVRTEPRSYEWPDGYNLRGYGYLTSDRVMREIFSRAKSLTASTADAAALATVLSMQDAKRKRGGRLVSA